MVYAIYGARGTGSSVVEAACAELGLDYEVRDLDARAGEHRGSAYAALNPQRKMPAVQIDGGEVLTESVAIVLTLDERHRDAQLMPPLGSRQRAEALRWMLFVATELYPLVEILDHPERYGLGGEGSQVLRDQAHQIWLQRWQVLEQCLRGGPSLLESGFCATDLFVAMLSRWDMDAGWRRDHLPRVEAIADAVRVRPAIVPVWARHFGGS